MPEDSGIPDVANRLIRVPEEAIIELRERIGGEEGKLKAYQFFPVGFGTLAEEVMEELHLAETSLTNVWEKYSSLVNVLALIDDARYAAVYQEVDEDDH